MNTRKVEDEIANRLAFVIGMLPYSVSEIADRLSVSKLNIYRYIAKTRKASLTFCKGFCDVYDVDYHWLLTGEGKPQKVDSYDTLSEQGKTELLNLIINNRPVVACYLKGETEYKEPYVIKSYRHAKSISRKAMQRLLIRGCEEIRKG